jgi:hypothetical protein
MRRLVCYCRYMQFTSTVGHGWSNNRRTLITDRNHFTESAIEIPTPLSVLYSVVEDAQRYKDYLKDNTQGIYDHELADFLFGLRHETSKRTKRAEELLAQRLANGGVQ